MTQIVPDISPLMPMHQDPLLVRFIDVANGPKCICMKHPLFSYKLVIQLFITHGLPVWSSHFITHGIFLWSKYLTTKVSPCGTAISSTMGNRVIQPFITHLEWFNYFITSMIRTFSHPYVFRIIRYQPHHPVICWCGSYPRVHFHIWTPQTHLHM